jgi:hypothetical protein
MQTQRQDLKDTFIRNKQTTRSLLLLLSTKDPGVAASKERRLKELQVGPRPVVEKYVLYIDVTCSSVAQDTFRDIDKEYKELGIQMDRSELLGENAQVPNNNKRLQSPPLPMIPSLPRPCFIAE